MTPTFASKFVPFRIGSLRRTLRALGFSGVFAAFAFAQGCTPSPTAGPPKNVQVSYAKRDGRVGTYTSTPWGFDTASYWIEGTDGLVLVDTQFLLSATEEFVNLAERTTG